MNTVPSSRGWDNKIPIVNQKTVTLQKTLSTTNNGNKPRNTKKYVIEAHSSLYGLQQGQKERTRKNNATSTLATAYQRAEDQRAHSPSKSQIHSNNAHALQIPRP